MPMYPLLFFRFYKIFAPNNNQKLLYANDTELVIEGFPRSANTFAVVTFKQAQSRPVKMAHHLHVEAQLVQAAKENKPAVALLRNPEDSFRSLMIRHPETPVYWAIQRYIHFYSAIKKLGSKCLVVTYEEVISDMGGVVEKINKRFGTDFDVPIHDDGMVKNVFLEVESINKRIDQGKESHVARPSDERSEQSQKLNLSGYETDINKAMELYNCLKEKNSA